MVSTICHRKYLQVLTFHGCALLKQGQVLARLAPPNLALLLTYKSFATLYVTNAAGRITKLHITFISVVKQLSLF